MEVAHIQMESTLGHWVLYRGMYAIDVPDCFQQTSSSFSGVECYQCRDDGGSVEIRQFIRPSGNIDWDWDLPPEEESEKRITTQIELWIQPDGADIEAASTLTPWCIG